MPPNDFVYDISTQQPETGNTGPSWCTNVAPYDATPAGIQNGLLFQYNTSVAIYKCPADQSTIQTLSGVTLPTPRLRSYNMSQSINGVVYAGQAATEIPHFDKTTSIRGPAPTELFVFLETHENEITDTEFGIPVVPDWWSQGYWWDIPANRHAQGCSFSFADGHVEHWKWKVPMQVTVPRGDEQPVADDQWDDYNRLQTGFRQDFN
ncbi:MAG TPA: hypothetical protein VK742_12875 [Candidatus Sulfotelmatobacter sp.]|nr:hypothetical protein [Candidatus Sulfotelmatobacter sp.]